MTLGQRLEDTAWRPTGFDYLRIVLACLVVAFHSTGLCYGDAFAYAFDREPGIHAATMIVLPMFFSLSGFLVAGSMARSRSLVGFLGLRLIRIYPALSVEMILSALLLGTIFTTLPLRQYFTDHLFFRYLLNVTGDVSFYLPGVFEHNPLPRLVNYQLWTVPFELYCYMIISFFIVSGLVKRPKALLAAVMALQILRFGHHILTNYHNVFAEKFAGHVAGPQLLMSFMAGVLLYQFKDRAPWRKELGVLSGIASLALFSVPLGEYLGVFTAAYFTVFLGLLNPRKLAVLQGADYSYGVYLYGWPVQQALVATGPWARHWWVNIIISLALATGFAALSWRFVEKPALNLKGHLRQVEDRWLVLTQAIKTRLRSSPLAPASDDAPVKAAPEG